MVMIKINRNVGLHFSDCDASYIHQTYNMGGNEVVLIRCLAECKNDGKVWLREETGDERDQRY